MTIRNRKRQAAKQVLAEAAAAPHFFDFSDVERLIWMLERAFEIGRGEGGLHHEAGQRGVTARRRRKRGTPTESGGASCSE